MNQASTKAFVEKAESNWKLAKELFDEGEINAAANRYYYAVFQSVKAFAVSNNKMIGIDNKGTAHQEALDVIGTSERAETWRKAFIRSKKLREKADYAVEDVEALELKASLVKTEVIFDHHIKKANDSCQ